MKTRHPLKNPLSILRGFFYHPRQCRLFTGVDNQAMDSNRTSNGGCLGLGLDLNTELRTLTLFQLKIRKGSIIRGTTRDYTTIDGFISNVEPATPDGVVTMFNPLGKRLDGRPAVNEVLISRNGNHTVASIHNPRAGHAGEDLLIIARGKVPSPIFGILHPL